MTWTDTQILILDAAERLFAAQGFGSTSLRMIVAEANVNLAAVHYHFGSKEGLIQQMFIRRIEPINAQRLNRLNELESEWKALVGGATSKSTGPTTRIAKAERERLKALIRAFVEPPLLLSHDVENGGAQFTRVLGRVFSEPDEALFGFFVQRFEEVVRRYISAFSDLLKHLCPAELFWRFQYMIGCMAHTVAMPCKMKEVVFQITPNHSAEFEVAQLVEFVAGGMLAPSNPEFSQNNDNDISIQDVFESIGANSIHDELGATSNQSISKNN